MDGETTEATSPAIELSHKIEVRHQGGVIELAEADARKLFHDLGELLKEDHRNAPAPVR